MKRKIIILTAITCAVMIPLIVLLFSYQQRLAEFAGNFTRRLPYKLSHTRVFDLKYNSYYIAGAREGQIYLGNFTVIPRLLKISALLKDTEWVKINIPDTADKINGRYEMILDSTNFYLYYGAQHSILKGNSNNWIAGRFDLECPYFQDVAIINNHSAVFRYASSKTKQNSFRKVSVNGEIIENDTVLEKQVDGKFCTSGKLEYNRQLNVLTYLYAYRNQILVMDTNLKLIKKIKTIDNIDTARFEVSTINSNGKRVVTSPTVLVNHKCATYKQYLLVNSKIMGKNEDDIKFQYSTAIDIYDIEKGEYVYSFYLPNMNRIDIRQLRVIDGAVYTMSERYLNKFSIKLPS